MASPKIGVLGQAAPGAGATGTLYTVPAGRRAACSVLRACETSSADTTVTVTVGVGGAAGSAASAQLWGTKLPANSVLDMSGIALGPGDKIYVGSDSGAVTFTLHGEESDVPA